MYCAVRIEAEKAKVAHEVSRKLTERILTKLNGQPYLNGQCQNTELEGVIDELVRENQALKSAFQEQVGKNHYQ